MCTICEQSEGGAWEGLVEMDARAPEYPHSYLMRCPHCGAYWMGHGYTPQIMMELTREEAHGVFPELKAGRSLDDLVVDRGALEPWGDDAREGVIAELRRLGWPAMAAALKPLLTLPVAELRCRAAEGAAVAGAAEAWELILPLLEDPEPFVRWHTCGLLHDLGDEWAVDALVRRVTADPDPQVRVLAAHALGEIGSVAAVPALRETAARDHVVDQLGYTPSGAARAALAAIAAKHAGEEI